VSWRASEAPEFKVAVALGKVPGWQRYRRFGDNDTVNGSGTTEEMWPPGTVRVIPTSAAVAVVSSTSTADNGVTPSTGALTVNLEGLNANYEEVSEVVTLNGLTTVNSTQTFLRLHRANIVQVGSGGVNAGAITATVNGNAQVYIDAENGQSSQLTYTVPGNKYWVLDAISLGCGRMTTGDLDMRMQIRLYNSTLGAYEGWRTVGDFYLYNGGNYRADNTVGQVLPPKTDVRCVLNSSAATQAFGILDGFLVRTDHLGAL